MPYKPSMFYVKEPSSEVLFLYYTEIHKELLRLRILDFKYHTKISEADKNKLGRLEFTLFLFRKQHPEYLI